MICYRDRTYCDGLCDGCQPDCDRLLTDEVKSAAERWWGKPGAPIAVRPARSSGEGEKRGG